MMYRVGTGLALSRPGLDAESCLGRVLLRGNDVCTSDRRGKAIDEAPETLKDITKNFMKSPLAGDAKDEATPAASLVYPKKTYWQKLKLYRTVTYRLDKF